MADLTYRAFLSYSHRDTEAAEHWHARLQAFPIHDPFRRMPTRLGLVPDTVGPIFRDRVHFPGGAELPEATRQALDQSMALVLLASPTAAASKYVNEEVRYFRWKYPDRPLVPVVVGPDGIEPATMFPRALAFRLDADGAITDEPFEVLAVDPRPGKDGEVIGTARIIGRLVGFDDHWAGRFVEHVAQRDREARAEVDLAERRRQEDRAKSDANHAALLAAIQQERGVPLPVLQAILATFGHDEALADPGRAEQALRAKADEYLALRDRLNRLTNDDPRVQALRRQAVDALAAGRFADADTLLAEAEQRDLDVVEELEANTARRRLSAAATRAERGAAARLGLDYRGAAGHYAEAARIAPTAETRTRWEYTLWQASALYAQGNEFGDNPALRDAIAAFWVALGLAPRELVPLDWAATQHNLGAALQALGERESGITRLEEAVTAYRAALEERTRTRVPLDWAATKNNLGTTFGILGARENTTARLEDAVAACRAALEEFTRARMPLDWAMTQTNLGNALWTLGARESGTARLEEAVTAYRAALEERTRDRVPLGWAMTQNNLGNALLNIGERESGTARLEEAVAAYRAALGERTRERVPLDWASTRYNMAGVLALLAARGHDRAALEEAFTCVRDAVTVFREGNITSTLPYALQRLSRLEAALAAWPAP